MRFKSHHPFDCSENFADLSELVGTTCALTWSFKEFWNGVPYGVYTEASKARFWGFPRDRKVLEYRPQGGWSSSTFFLASRLLTGRWLIPMNCLETPTLVDESGNAIVTTTRVLPNKRSEKHAIFDTLWLLLGKSKYRFREFGSLHRKGSAARELLDANDRIVISGNCGTKELVIHHYNEDIPALYPCFVALLHYASCD